MQIDSRKVQMQRAGNRFPTTDSPDYPVAEHDALKIQHKALYAKIGKDNPQADALLDYGSSSYVNVNRRLRTGSSFPDDPRLGDPSFVQRMNKIHASVDSDVAHLDDIMKMSSSRAPMSVFRIMNSTIDTSDLQPGTEYVDKGFLSTTADPAKYKAVAVLADPAATTMEIRVPKDTPSFYLGGSALGNAKEREMLLDRGLTYRVLANDPVSKHLIVEVVPNGK